MGSRKVFAVKEKHLKISKEKYPAASTSSSDDSDDVCTPKPKRLKCDVGDVGQDIKEIKASLSSLFQVQKSMKIPLALRRVFLEDFKCTICQDVITPPAIFSRCCKYLIGCETCIDQWYEGEGGRSKTCPRCRAERGFTETCRLNGIDNFLLSLKSVLGESLASP